MFIIESFLLAARPTKVPQQVEIDNNTAARFFQSGGGMP